MHIVTTLAQGVNSVPTIVPNSERRRRSAGLQTRQQIDKIHLPLPERHFFETPGAPSNITQVQGPHQITGRIKRTSRRQKSRVHKQVQLRASQSPQAIRQFRRLLGWVDNQGVDLRGGRRLGHYFQKLPGQLPSAWVVKATQRDDGPRDMQVAA